MSRAVVRWPAAGRPVGFLKTVRVMPSWRALWFMRWVKLRLLPLICWDMAMAASLPEATAIPVRSWSTVTLWRGRKRMLEPPTRAVGWTRMLVLRFRRPILMRSMTTYMVMTLIREAGGMDRLGLCSYSTLPLLRLIMTAARALRAASAPAGSESMARTSSRTHSQRPGMEGEWNMSFRPYGGRFDGLLPQPAWRWPAARGR